MLHSPLTCHPVDSYLPKEICPLSVFVVQSIDLRRHFIHLSGRTLDRGGATPFAPPAPHIAVHLVPPPLFLRNVLAEFAAIGLLSSFVHKLESARLAHPVLFVALLPEVAPSPVATRPASLFEVTHRLWRGRLPTQVERPGSPLGLSLSILSQRRGGRQSRASPHRTRYSPGFVDPVVWLLIRVPLPG